MPTQKISANVDNQTTHYEIRQLRYVAVGLGLGGMSAFILACAAYWGTFGDLGLSHDGKDWAEFGEYVGGFAGPAISVVTLVALAYTMVIQAMDLTKTRAFIAQQTRSMEQQSETLSQQAFDSVFFNLLERFNNVRDGVKFSHEVDNIPIPTTRVLTGTDAFRSLYNVLSRWIAKASGASRLGEIQKGFEDFYEEFESELGPYYRTLYHIFKFIHKHPGISEQQRVDYANIARAQLSDIELCVLFYDGLTTYAEYFKPLIEHYGILRHVNKAHLFIPSDKDDSTLYPPKAFLPQAQRDTIDQAGRTAP